MIQQNLAMEMELDYADDFPFVDYGVDLQIMAETEKGVKVTQLTRTDYDANPPKEEEWKCEEKLKMLRSRKGDRLPLEYKGKFPKGYLLVE